MGSPQSLHMYEKLINTLLTRVPRPREFGVRGGVY